MKWTPPKRGLGRDARANAAARRSVFGQVLRRARFRCEGCGGGEASLEWCHVLGRPHSGANLGPLANSAALTMALCPDCHRAYDQHRDVELRLALLSRALDRLAGRPSGHMWHELAGLSDEAKEDWLKAEIRAQVRELEAAE